MGVCIFLGIVLLLAFLLSAPLYIAVSYEKSAAISVKYLFFRFRISPKKEKKQKRPGKSKTVHEESKEPDKKKKSSGGLSQVLDIASLIVNAAKRLLRRVKIGRLMLDIEVGGEDASRTAIEYGAVSAVLYPLCSAVLASFDVNENKFFVNLNARYDLKKTEFAVNAEVGASPAVIIAIAVSVIFKYIINTMGNNKNSKKEIIKGGAAK